MNKKPIKIMWMILGFISLGLGAVGAVLPLLPSFPFLMLALFSFTRSSKRVCEWFLGTGLYKKHLEPFVEKKSMTVKTKITIMSTVTVLMLIGFIMMHQILVGRIILAGIWIFHLLYFWFGIKTISQGNPAGEQS